VSGMEDGKRNFDLPGPPIVQTILLISGSTRAGSTNSALVRTAALCAPTGITAVTYDGLTALPHFNPDDDHEPLPAPVAQLRAAIAAANAVLFCTPEYAGTLPGSFKNLLDWTVGAIVMTDKPVAWVNAAVEPRRGAGAQAALATVLGYVQARIVEGACRHVPVPRESVGPQGLIADANTRDALRGVLANLTGASRDDAVQTRTLA
jgi:chromate reductase, NAD(P)H dehydrogenase (quinone)